MNVVETYLIENGFSATSVRSQSSYDPGIERIDDFFRGESRVTVVKMVDKYQVMVYDSKITYDYSLHTEECVVNFLKGIL
jgi:hypothetical protein